MKRIVYWAFTILIPCAVFVLFELGLRLGNYNEDKQDLFVEVPVRPEYVVVNPAFVSRYFPAFTPDIAKSHFLKKKEEDTFRIFVLGGSSAQGFPYNFYNSFALQLEQRLLMETRGINVEVINLGMTAVNSFVLWDLSKRLMEYEPDAVLIYAGHNEYYGSFGVGSTQFGVGLGVGLKRLILKLKNLRIYQLFEDMIGPEADDENPNNRTLMARVIKDSGIPLGSEVYNAGIDQFQNNVSDMLEYFYEKSVPVFIGTVTSNLKDQAPLSDDKDALMNFEKGNNWYQAGRIDSAHFYYLKAKEYDAIRFRAPEAINDVIVKEAQKYNARLVDVNKAAARASESKIQDESFFTDHLHPDWKGQQLIADLFFDALRAEIDEVNNAYSKNPLFKKDSITEFEKVYADVQIKRLTAGYPFKKGLTGEQEYARFQVDYENYLESSYVDSIAATAWRTQRDKPLALTDVLNYVNKTSDTLSVLKHYQDLVYWQILNDELLKKVVNYAINDRGYDPYSAKLLHIMLSIKRDDPFFANRLAALYLIYKDLDRSEYWLQKVKELDAESLLLWYNYTRFYSLKGDTANARQAFETYNRLRSKR